MTADERASILADTSVCSAAAYLENELPPTPFIAANGRVFSPEDGSLKMDDVELLLNLELGKAKGITKLLASDLSFMDNAQYDAVAQACAFLAEQQSNSKDKRSDMESMVLNLEKAMGIESNPLRFSWNNEDDGESLKVSSLGVSFSLPLLAILTTAPHLFETIDQNFCSDRSGDRAYTTNGSPSPISS